MKKIISIILALVMLSSVVYADSEPAKSEKTIKYIKADDVYDCWSEIVYIARDSESGDIIPLAIGPLDGYSYAYIQGDKDFVIEKLLYSTPFNDLGEKYEYESYIDEISARGVVVGYDDGSFKPDNILTRAEMAAVFARMFGVQEQNSPSCFGDIPENHWAREYIMALVDKGVFMKDDSFNPDSPITREQLVAMTFRMLSDMNMTEPQESGGMDKSKILDFDKVSDYARVAYNALSAENYNLMIEIVENDFMDTADDEFYLHPQAEVTRAECCDFLYCFIRTFFAENAPAIRLEDSPAEEIPILDGSTSTYDITKNIYMAYYRNSQNHPDMPKAHSKTTNSYKRLIDGEVEMIFVPDASEEVLNYAREKGVELEFIPIANEALVFFTGTKNPVNNITTEQLHNIYVNNGITNWKELGGEDCALAAYCRNTDSGSHAQMERFILNGKEISDEISKERTSIIMSSILTDVDDYNKNSANGCAMGYSLYYYYFNNQSILGPVDLKLMSIDGVMPSEESIADRSYPYTTNYYAVIRGGENNPKVDAFAKLMQTEFGDFIAMQSGLGVFKTPEEAETDKFEFASVDWGTPCDDIQNKWWIYGELQDDGQRSVVKSEDFGYLDGVNVTALFQFDEQLNTGYRGLYNVTFVYDDADEERLLSAMTEVYGEMKESYADKNGVLNPIGGSGGWVSKFTPEECLNDEQLKIFSEQFSGKNRLDVALRAPLVSIVVYKDENRVEFKGSTAAMVKYLREVSSK